MGVVTNWWKRTKGQAKKWTVKVYVAYTHDEKVSVLCERSKEWRGFDRSDGQLEIVLTPDEAAMVGRYAAGLGYGWFSVSEEGMPPDDRPVLGIRVGTGCSIVWRQGDEMFNVLGCFPITHWRVLPARPPSR